jgi:glycosyl transferase family 25
VINLDRSPARLARIGGDLERLGIAFTRFAAIDGRGIDPDATSLFDRRGYERRHGKMPAPCEIGCFLSHIGVMREFLQSDAAFCLILEDDAIVSPELPSVLRGLTRLEGEWNVALLYGNYDGVAMPLARVDRGHALAGFLARQTGAVAYAVDRQAAEIYLRELLPMSLPIDVDFDRAWDFGIRFRGVVPFPVRTGAHPSDIGPVGAKFPWYRRMATYAVRGIGELKRYRHYAFHDPVWWQSWRYRAAAWLHAVSGEALRRPRRGAEARQASLPKPSAAG